MVAGLLLTGGSSRRMGRDKASIELAGERLADRAARILSAVAAPVVEVGDGVTGLPAVAESPRGAGPLAAVAAGTARLLAGGHTGAVLVLAVDLPRVEAGLLRLLADRPGKASVVPVAFGHDQPLCARYAQADLRTAARLVAQGASSMRALLEAIDAERVPPEVWCGVAAADAFEDVDTPEDLERLGGGQWPT